MTPQQCAKTLKATHDRLRSWRKVADIYRPIPAGTLCRVAKSNGAYTPKDPVYRLVLGLPGRHTRPLIYRAWRDLPVADLRTAIIQREDF